MFYLVHQREDVYCCSGMSLMICVSLPCSDAKGTGNLLSKSAWTPPHHSVHQLLKICRLATSSLWDAEGYLYSEPEDTGNVKENIPGQYD